MTYFLVPIVEGQTEERCIEKLLQRIWSQLLNAPSRLQVLRPSRAKRDALLNPDHSCLADKIEEARVKLVDRLRRDSSAHGLLLLLLDSEKNCPAQIAPRLLERSRAIVSDIAITCVLAKRMLENWIVAGASSLSGVNDLPALLPPRDQFEDRSGANWLDTQLRGKNSSRKYKTADAEAFVAAMDLLECRANAPSFDKLCRELERWIGKDRDATA